MLLTWLSRDGIELGGTLTQYSISVYLNRLLLILIIFIDKDVFILKKEHVLWSLTH